MNRSRTLATIGLGLALAASVWWMLHRGDSGNVKPVQRTAATTSPMPQSVAPDYSMGGPPSKTKNLTPIVTENKYPNPVLPAGAANLRPSILPAGLEQVRLAVNSSGNLGFAERVHAIRAIRGELTGAAIDAFAGYLRTSARRSGNSDGENWVRNEMLDLLVQQAELPPGVAGLLVSVYQDMSQDPVMRDYAIQHMPSIYERVSAEDQANLRNALWQATGESSTGIAGTALLALLTVAETNLGIDQGRLAQAALDLATNDGTSELARITAIQVCGRLGVQQALPVVEQLTGKSPNMPLRIAATAALGDYAMNETESGSAQAASLLTHLAQSSDPRQAAAAQAALRRIAHTRTSLAQRTPRQTGL